MASAKGFDRLRLMTFGNHIKKQRIFERWKDKHFWFLHCMTENLDNLTLDPRANIIDVYIWMLFDDVLALASSSEKNYVM